MNLRKSIFLAFLAVVIEESHSLADPCCSFPCENQGVCMSTGYDSYTCDCTGLEYYGKNCETPTFSRRIKNLIRPTQETFHKLYTGIPWFWNIANKIPFLQKAAMKYVYMSRAEMIDSPVTYNTGHDYTTLDTYYDKQYYARSLPAVPKNCPTPMGTRGYKELPDIDILAERFFRRRVFKPEPHGTNTLFAYWAQHFSHQFLKTDTKKGPAYTWASDGVDVSHIYGADLRTQQALRSFQGGKMKTRIINGEAFPPLLKDTPDVVMHYPPGTSADNQIAIGHPFLVVLPGLVAIATIWLREHNRLCDILSHEHPEWDDERIYQTAKLIVLGETLKITIEEYVKHLSQYNVKLTFEPELLHGTSFQYSNRMHIEFNHLYHWHPIVPDAMMVNGTEYGLEEMAFNVKPLEENGLDSFVEALVNSRAGALSHHNHGAMVLHVLKKVVGYGREVRLQSFNNYRKRYNLKPYKSFLELTGDQQMAKELEELYGDIDALEFYPGLLLEQPGSSVTPFTMVQIGGPMAIKGMMANPICSPQYWKASTFGGQTGFNIVKTTTVKDLFCRNMNGGNCEEISFKVPENFLEPQGVTPGTDAVTECFFGHLKALTTCLTEKEL